MKLFDQSGRLCGHVSAWITQRGRLYFETDGGGLIHAKRVRMRTHKRGNYLTLINHKRGDNL